MSADWAFESALTFFRQGRLEQAKNLCAQLVDRHPRHHNGLHLLGAVTLQMGELEAGLDHVRAAIAADPGQAGAYATLANALMQQRRAPEALPYYEMAVRLSPNDADLHNNHGAALREAGRFQEALRSVDRALALNPSQARAHNNRGNTLRDMKRLDEALAAYEQAVELDPKNLLAQDNRQRLLQSLGRAPAEGSVDMLALGDQHLAAGQHEAALHCYDQRLRIDADDAEALNRRGIALLEMKRAEDAVLAFRRVLDIEANHAPAHNNLGNALRELERPESALEHYTRATELAPSTALYWFHRAQVLMRMDRNEEAIPCLDHITALQPDFPFALATRVAAQRSVCEWQGLTQRTDMLTEAVRAGQQAEQPFQTLIHADDPKLHLLCAQRHAAQRFPARPPLWQAPVSARRTERLRIVYMSADFHDHATSQLMAGLFECHDRDRFEVYACSFGPERLDSMRERLLRAFDRFIDIRHLDDEWAARLLLEHRVDIAVDLKGYTHLGRPGILAHRPAPVQVSYLGYPGTLGAPYIDYIVADRYVLPPQQHQHYTEKVVTLPECYQVNDAARVIAEHRPGRTELGLPEDAVVFCCFNNSGKLGPQMFDIWMRLLLQVPGSVLWLLADFAAVERNLRREAAERGVGPHRLVFAPRLRNAEHLARLAQADLFLDTLPYNAHTTTSDALWAGVPVLTCRGRAFAGRVAASLLQAVGLPELITDDLAAYEAKALQLAREPGRLIALRVHLQSQRAHAPLFDTQRFRRHLESAYELMWQRHAQGLAPEAFDVPPHIAAHQTR